ncbi:MAG TPA: aldose 1-epimerase [Conexibacter sp.]|jgi:galactose mutarotase-like enzyme
MIEQTEEVGFAGLRLRDADGDVTATFVPKAGMVGISLQDAGVELLGQRRGLAAYVDEGRTMGIPLLHPWANRLARDSYSAAGVAVDLPISAPGLHRDGNGLAIHGLLPGARDWQVEHADDLAAATSFTATFDFAAHPELLASFPFPHALRLEIALANRTLTVTTTLTATGETAVPVAYGFHPYLTLPGTPRAQWQLELPPMTHLQLDDRGIPTGTSLTEPSRRLGLGSRTFDDAYTEVEQGAELSLLDDHRRIDVTFEQGFPATQVFAPAGEDVVCFEPMTAPTNALVSGKGLRLVAPGEEDVTRFSIALADTQQWST